MTDRNRPPISSENLVPQGLPHGQRQLQLDLRRQAGVPITTREGLPAPLAGNVARVGNLRAEDAVRPVRSDLDVLRDFTPDQLPGFAGVADPELPLASRGAPPQTLVDRLDAQAAQSNNRFMRAVAQRMRLRLSR